MRLLLSLIPAATALEGPAFVEIGGRALPGVEVTCGSPRKDYILEVNGGGLALADFDGDGRCDLVVVDGSTLERVAKGEPGFPPRTFLGNGDGTFRPAGEAWQLAGGRWGTGTALGDFDGDGWLDLAITQWGPTRVLLNRAGKGWREVTATAGLGAGSWGTSAAVLDFDRDGKLDLFVANYLQFDPERVAARGSSGCRWKGHDVMCGPEGLVPLAAQLFRGAGDGSFADVSASAGLPAAKPAFGLGVMTLDADLDDDTDLFVANDSTANHLWLNQGDGTFLERGYDGGVSHDANGKEQASMGIGCADWNGDGAEDLFVTNFSGENNAFYVSTKKRVFRERSAPTGLAGPSIPMLGWGTALADLDLDGDLDVFVLNGHVYPEADQPGTDTSYAQPDQLYRNDGAQRFVVEALSDGRRRVSRAGALADLDLDGDLDLVALPIEGAVRVLQNQAPHDASHHWLTVVPRAARGDRFALGARVTLLSGGKQQVRTIRTAGGYQASVPPEAHFGLGAAQEIERLEVRFPSGATRVIEKVRADQRLVVQEAP